MSPKTQSFVSVCCNYNVYPYFSFSVSMVDGHIDKDYEGYRCIKCGQKTYVKERKELNVGK